MAQLQIQRREKEGIAILELNGRLIVGDACTLLREKVNEEVAAGVTSIILDLKEVDFIDSTGLGSMVICFTTLQKAKGKMKLLHLNRRNIELLLLTKLSTVFELFNEEQQAVNSYFPDREITHFDILSFVKGQKDAG